EVEVGGVNLKPANAGAYLSEAELTKIKGIFWRNNIVGYAPMLPVVVKIESAEGKPLGGAQLLGTYFKKQLRFGKQEFTTGVEAVNPWWHVAGNWPRDDSNEVLIGHTLAQRLNFEPGATLRVNGEEVKVVGLLLADEATNQQIVGPLGLAQKIAARPGAVRRVMVSAMTKPEDAFARRDPRSMSPADRDRWYCSPYANSIALQLEEAIPGAKSEQIRQVAQNEGTVLSRISGLMLLLAVAALIASALAVSAAMANTIFERREEIGLMKALGAGRASVAALFLAEAAILALIGGALGFSLGALLAQQIGRTVFASAIAVQPVLAPIILAVAAIVTFAGSAASIRRAVRLEAAPVLRGDA